MSRARAAAAAASRPTADQSPPTPPTRTRRSTNIHAPSPKQSLQPSAAGAAARKQVLGTLSDVVAGVKGVKGDVYPELYGSSLSGMFFPGRVGALLRAAFAPVLPAARP